MIQDQTPVLLGEIWKLIPGCEGKYSVSNLGRVKRNERDMIRKDGKKLHIPERILHQSIDRPDNKNRCYYNTIIQGKCCYIHRLVALAFLPNTDNLPCVNHRNENKLDNRAENLEWCSYSYNNSYNNRSKNIGIKLTGRIPCNAQALKVIETRETFSSISDFQKSYPMKFYKVKKLLEGKEVKGFPYHLEPVSLH